MIIMLDTKKNSIILEGKCKLMSAPSVKKLWAAEKEDIVKSIGIDEKLAEKLFKFCCKAVQKTVKAQKDLFKTVVQAAAKADDGSDDQQEEDDVKSQSVSKFNKIYKKILFEANAEDKNMSSGSATVIKMIVKGNDVRFQTKDGTPISPDDYKRLDQELNGHYSELKPGTPFHTASKSVSDADKAGKDEVINGIAKADVDFESLSENDVFGDNEINADAAKKVLEVAVNKLNTKLVSKVIAKANIEDPQKASEGIANMLAIAIAGKGNAIFKGMAKHGKAKAKEADDKKKQFIEDCKKFQEQLPAQQIAKVCDLPGTTDIKISPETILYDINGKKIGTKWGLDQQIDSDSQISQWAQFLKANNGQNAPAHPLAIAAAIAQQAAGLTEATGYNTLEGFADAGIIAGGVATAVFTAGLSIPATLAIPVVKGILKKEHVRTGAKLLQTWYDKAMQLANKYKEFMPKNK